MKNNMRGGTVRLLGFELKKLLTAVNIIVFLILMLIKPLMTVWYVPPEYEYNLEFYHRYTDELYGGHTAEKSEYISAELLRLEDIVAKEQSMYDLFGKGEISGEELSSYNTELIRASNRIPALKRVKEHCDYFNNIEGKTPWWFYELDCSEFLSGYGADPLFLVFIIVFGLRFLGADEIYGMSLSVMAMPLRQKRERISIAALMILSFAGCVISFAFDVLTFVIRCGGEYFNMPICSMEIFADCGYDVTIIQYILLILLVRIVWSIAVCLILQVIRLLIKNMYTCLAAAAAVIFIPLAAAKALPEPLKTALAGAQMTGFAVAETSLVASVIAAAVTAAAAILAIYLLQRKKS